MNLRFISSPNVDVPFTGVAQLVETTESPVVANVATNMDVKTYTKPYTAPKVWRVTATGMTEAEFFALKAQIFTNAQAQKTPLLWTPLANSHSGTPNTGTDMSGYFTIRVWEWGEAVLQGIHWSWSLVFRQEV